MSTKNLQALHKCMLKTVHCMHAMHLNLKGCVLPFQGVFEKLKIHGKDIKCCALWVEKLLRVFLHSLNTHLHPLA